MDKFAGYLPTWCPGCGNWGIITAIKSAMAKLDLGPSDVMLSFGIGCSGNMNDFLNGYALHGLHGRAIPAAIGMKIANNKMPVIAIVGDGDFYGEGGNHFLHACRGNHDITVLVHNNNVYGLTTGQAAPTAQKGYKSKSTPSGIIEEQVNPLALAVSQGATFVAQGFAGDMIALSDIIKQAVKHKGFSLVNILQPCVTFNKTHDFNYFREHSYEIPDSHDATCPIKAFKTSIEPVCEQKYPLGIIYKVKKTCYTDHLPQMEKKPLIDKARFTKFEEIIKDYI